MSHIVTAGEKRKSRLTCGLHIDPWMKKPGRVQIFLSTSSSYSEDLLPEVDNCPPKDSSSLLTEEDSYLKPSEDGEKDNFDIE